jgi:hypothetical protein
MPRKPEDLLEAAMGLVSNAEDWLIDKNYDTPSNVEWRAAGREWLDDYQRWLKQHLEEKKVKMPDIKVQFDDDTKDLIRAVIPPVVEIGHTLTKLWAGTLERYDRRASKAENVEASASHWDIGDSYPADAPSGWWRNQELLLARDLEDAQRALARVQRRTGRFQEARARAPRG